MPRTLHNYLFLFTTFVMACRIVMPAFSISFRERPMLMHTFNAGCSSHPVSFGPALTALGMLFNRVISTPLASVCTKGVLVSSCPTHHVFEVQPSYLIDNILQQCLLLLNAQLLARDDLRLEHKQHDWILNRTGTVNPVAPRIQLRPHRFDVLSYLREEVGSGLKQA